MYFKLVGYNMELFVLCENLQEFDPTFPGGHSTFFQVGVCGPDIKSVGLANCYLPLKREACELKISNLGACG